MTYLFPQDLVLREPLLRLALIGYDTVIATRSTKPGLETGDNSRGSLFWKERVSWDFGSLWRGWKGTRFMEPGDFA